VKARSAAAEEAPCPPPLPRGDVCPLRPRSWAPTGHPVPGERWSGSPLPGAGWEKLLGLVQPWGCQPCACSRSCGRSAAMEKQAGKVGRRKRRRCEGAAGRHRELRSVPGWWGAGGQAQRRGLASWALVVPSPNNAMLVCLESRVQGILRVLWQVNSNTALETHGEHWAFVLEK